MGKKPATTKIFQDRAGTPATKGLPLLQQISSAGLKQSSKKKQAIHVKTTEKQRVKVEQDHCQKETMFPFADKGMDERKLGKYCMVPTQQYMYNFSLEGPISFIHCIGTFEFFQPIFMLTSSYMKRNEIVSLFIYSLGKQLVIRNYMELL